ncbi:hypothetical protein, partial [[Eubacterium] cellulosolvens]
RVLVHTCGLRNPYRHGNHQRTCEAVAETRRVLSEQPAPSDIIIYPSSNQERKPGKTLPTTLAFPRGSIQSWPDKERPQMLAEPSFTTSELERKQVCLFG